MPNAQRGLQGKKARDTTEDKTASASALSDSETLAFGQANPSESQLKKEATPARDRLFGRLLASRRLLVAWLCVRKYVAYTTTGFVWISNRGSMAGLFSLASFARHGSARCFPVGKPANTPRELLDSLEVL